MTGRLALLAAVGALVAGCAGIGTTAAAVAATDWRPVPETGAPGRLVLHTGAEPLVLPGAGVTETAWQVRTSVEVAADGRVAPVTLDLEVRKDGALARAPGGLVVAVSSCDRAWTTAGGASTCSSGAAELVSATPADDWSATSPVVRIPDADGDGTAYLLVQASLPDGTATGLAGRLGIGGTARGAGPTTPSTTPATTRPSARPTVPAGVLPSVAPAPSGSVLPTVLAFTGGGFAGPVLIALAAVLAGLALRLRGERRRPVRSDS